MKFSKKLLATVLAFVLSLPTLSLAKDLNKIDLNTATVKQLMSIKGIGEAKAASIVTYREDNGRFKSIIDLEHISGIGPKRLAKISPYLTVSGG